MSWDAALLHHLARRLRVDLELAAPVRREPDGTFRYEHPSGRVVTLRPVLEAPWPLVRISAVVASGVRKSAALLSEINAWNVEVGWTKAVLEASKVTICADLFIGSIEAEELGAVVREVAERAERMAEVLGVAYGWVAPAEETWRPSALP